MFTKPIFETLPIVIITLSLLLIAFVHHPIALISGVGLLVASVLMIYRHYTDLGNDQDAVNGGHSI